MRGRTLIACIIDEIAFLRSEDSVNPDFELLKAIRPSMLTLPGSMLLCGSSPYSRRGELWEHYRRWHGVADAPCLVWQGATEVMNPTVPGEEIAKEYALDPASAAAEYGAEFRTDIAGFVTREAILAVTVSGRRELLPALHMHYVAFVDPSGGVGNSMTLAVAHKMGDLVVLDCLREVVPPFSPESVVREFARVLQSYKITRVAGDHYAGEWVRGTVQGLRDCL